MNTSRGNWGNAGLSGVPSPEGRWLRLHERGQAHATVDGFYTLCNIPLRPELPASGDEKNVCPRCKRAMQSRQHAGRPKRR